MPHAANLPCSWSIRTHKDVRFKQEIEERTRDGIGMAEKGHVHTGHADGIDIGAGNGAGYGRRSLCGVAETLRAEYAYPVYTRHFTAFGSNRAGYLE
ncbi:hypothetical protein MCC01954_12910 [Bifidobacteriaceae bacterium MCC01954]|nr:hypothetical protein MCC01954_12910 [Bifidobacteriaceae bacterium MCC01954]